MKIRNGFVSNSSSSSFLLITTIENHNHVMGQLTNYERAVIIAIMKTTENSKQSLFGREVVCLEEFSGESYYTIGELVLEKKWEEFEEKECPDYPEDIRNNAWEKYQELVKEYPGEVFIRKFNF